MAKAIIYPAFAFAPPIALNPPVGIEQWAPVYVGKIRHWPQRPSVSHEIHAAPPAPTPPTTTPDQWAPVFITVPPSRRKALWLTQEFVTAPPASTIVLIPQIWCACIGEVGIAGAAAGLVITTGAVAGDVDSSGAVAGQAGCC